MPAKPPRPRLPSLNELRAFEAAARRQSFTAAADGLGVTAGAVTQPPFPDSGRLVAPFVKAMPTGD